MVFEKTNFEHFQESPKRVQFAIAEPETVEHTSNVSQTNGDAVTVIDEENGNTSTSPNEQTGANGVNKVVVVHDPRCHVESVASAPLLHLCYTFSILLPLLLPCYPEYQIKCVNLTSIVSTCVISSPNPMFDYLLESSR